MLRVIPSVNAAAAIAYFSEGLRREDYYNQDLEAPSRWRGKAAERLGLKGEVTLESFTAIAENLNPETGKTLTVRQKQNRVAGADINMHAPKSLSILQGLTGDADLLRVFQEAVSETMLDIEKMASTRVRLNDAQSDRVTGELIWAEFLHGTTRPIGGMPDPHLHAHNWVANVTWDETESRWKATKFHDLKKFAPLHEAAFHARLSKKVADLGYTVRKTKDRWEIDGIPQALLERFSRRTALIEAEAIKRGIVDDRLRDGLGAKTREKKRKGMTQPEMVASWNARLHDDEKALIQQVYASRLNPGESRIISVSDAVDFAENCLFERSSVAKREALLELAMEYGVGSLLPEEIKAEFERRDYIEARSNGDNICTKMDLVVEELDLIEAARKGRNQHSPLTTQNWGSALDSLSVEQRAAASQILLSRDRVSGLRGRAGTGKTTLLKAIKPLLENQGFRIHAFAPSATGARVVLKDAGFEGETIARLLVDEKLQRQVRGRNNIILIDECGLLGIRELAEVLRIAGPDTRIILCGDSGQHSSVSRGDALRLLETYGHLPMAELTEIYRQKADYKAAIEFLADGDLSNGFNKLDEIGAIVTILDDVERYAALATEWFEKMEESGVDPLVVSPTNREAALVTEAIRAKLKEAGHLGANRNLLQFLPLRLEEAAKGWIGSYSPGMVVRYHQNAKGIIRGAVLTVDEITASEVWLKAEDGKRRQLDFKTAKHFQVYEVGTISVARGERLKITEGGKSLEGKRLNNGDSFVVSKIKRDGTLVSDKGVTLASDHAHLAHGYCSTSHASQGRSVKDVFVAQHSSSGRASNREQWYVSLSRGMASLRIFTDNDSAMKLGVSSRSSRRISALEFSGAGKAIFMSDSNSKEWVQRVAAHRNKLLKAEPSFAEKVKTQRSVKPSNELSMGDFADFVKSRSPRQGGKSHWRTKSTTQLAQAKREKGDQSMHVARRMDTRDNTPEKAKEKGRAAKPDSKLEAKPQSPNERRIGNAMDTVKARFKEVMERGTNGLKAMKDSANRAIQFGNVKTTLGKLNGKDTQKAQAESQAREQQKAPAVAKKPDAPKPTPVPQPVIRRGR